MNALEVGHGPVVTFKIILQWKEEDGIAPFSADEMSLALNVARAHYYAHTLIEDLPARAGLTTIAAVSWSWGIRQVCERRAGRIRECYCDERG